MVCEPHAGQHSSIFLGSEVVVDDKRTTPLRRVGGRVNEMLFRGHVERVVLTSFCSHQTRGSCGVRRVGRSTSGAVLGRNSYEVNLQDPVRGKGAL